MSQAFGHEKRYREIIARIITCFILINLCVASGLYYFHVKNQREGLANKIGGKCLALGSAIIETVEEALDLGIPLNRFKGVDEYLSEKLDSAAELDYIAITDSMGNVLYKSTEPKVVLDTLIEGAFLQIAKAEKAGSAPVSVVLSDQINFPVKIKSGDKLEGFVNIGLSRKDVNDRILEIFFDLAMIVIAILIMGHEFIGYLFLNAIVYPFKELFESLNLLIRRNFKITREPSSNEDIASSIVDFNAIVIWMTGRFFKLKMAMAKLADVKAPARKAFEFLEANYAWPTSAEPSAVKARPIVYNIRLLSFLFVLSDATIMPYVPAYATRFYDPGLGLSKSMLGSLPVLVFMISATITILLHAHAKIAERFGYKKIIIFGSMLSACGYLGLAIYDSLVALLIARFIIGIGFSLCYVSYQGFVGKYASDDERLSASVVFLIAMGAGYMCGSPIGGVVIDNLGFRFAAYIPFVSILFSALFAKKYLTESDLGLKKIEEKRVSLLRVAREKPILRAVLYSGFPLRFLYSSMLCFLYPLYLQALGNSEAMIGRIMMIFGVLTFVFSPLSPKIVGAFANNGKTAIWAALCLGVFLLCDNLTRDTLGVAISVGVYTVCSTVHTTALLAVLNEEAEMAGDRVTKESVLGFYFIFERVAMIFGAPVTAFLLKFANYSQALFVIGVYVIVNTLIFWRYRRVDRNRAKVA